MGSFLGGGGGGSSSSKSGFAALPKALQDVFSKLGFGVEQYTNPANAGVTDMFSPLAQTAEETSALDAFRAGFAPNQQTIQSDIAMQMNPFDTYVIDEINRQAGGDYSILKQALSEAGQQGSNRQALGANDIDLTRLDQIGKFKQGQYNTALNNALNILPQQRTQDAQAKLGVGEFLRGLDMQTKLAPVTALQTGTGMISPFVSGSGVSTQKSGGSGILGSLGSIGGLLTGLNNVGWI